MGEKSTAYIESETAASRIAKVYPQAKILLILRDPVERAISNYWFSVNSGLETLPIDQAFLHEDERRLDYDPEKISVSPYAYLKRGCYIDYLLMYESYFPAGNIKVMLYEQLIGSEAHSLDLYAFLGVSDYTPPVLHTTVNKGDKPDISLSSELQQYLVDSRKSLVPFQIESRPEKIWVRVLQAWPFQFQDDHPIPDKDRLYLTVGHPL